jgi:hypothetical protein
MGYAQTRRIPMWRPPEEIAMMQESAAFYVLAGKTCALVSGPLDEGEAKVSVVCDAAFRQGCLAQMSAREVLVAAFDGHAMMVFPPPLPPLPTALYTTTSTSLSPPLNPTFLSLQNHEEAKEPKSQPPQSDNLKCAIS